MSACVPARPRPLQNYSATKKANCKRQNPNPAFGFDSKKKLARTIIRASSLESVSYANLIAIVVMIPMVAVNPMPIIPIIPVVPGAVIIAIGPIGSIISVRIIPVSVTRIAIIAVPISWIPESNSNAPNSH
jgi:hypothetical protein